MTRRASFDLGIGPFWGLDLAGWVANRYDGTVEAVAQGPRRRIDEFVESMRTEPTLARVRAVSVLEEAPVGEGGPFTVR